jgi:CheY-like chemotaxis protein
MNNSSDLTRLAEWAANPTPDSLAQLNHALHHPATCCHALIALKAAKTDEAAQLAVDFLTGSGQRTADDGRKLFDKINVQRDRRIFKGLQDNYGDIPLCVWLVSQFAAAPDEYAEFLEWRAGLNPHLITVVTLDDAPEACNILRLMINVGGDMLMVGEAPDAIQGAEVVRRLQPDVILLDHMMPKLDSIGAVRLLRPLAPNSKIIYRSYNYVDMHPMRDEVLAEGADAWMDYGPILPRDVPPIIRRAYYGEDVPS